MAMKYLLAVDGSACAERATAALIAHAEALAVPPEIHLVHVHPPIPIGRVQAHIGHDTLERYYREEAEAELTAAKARLAAAGLAFTPHIHVGQPAEVIAGLAAELDVDLIVIGSHGRGAMAALVAGSVAARVLHLAPCPVLMAK